MKYVLLPMFRFIIVIVYYLLGLLSTILIYTIFGYILRDIIWNFNFKYKLLDDVYFEKDNIFGFMVNNGWSTFKKYYYYKTGFHWCIDIENKNGKYVGNKYRNRLL